MARGKGRPFEKGNNANPLGRRAENKEFIQFKQMTYKDFIDKMQEFGCMSNEQLKKVVENKNTPVFQLIFARMLFEAQKGNLKAAELIMDRMWGKVKETDLKTIDVTHNVRPLQNATPEQLKSILEGNVISIQKDS